MHPTKEASVRKIVINPSFGGYSLSDEIVSEYNRATGSNYEPCDAEYEIPRDDPTLVAIVESLGDKASRGHGALRIVEIPEDVDWIVTGYDGTEWVAEKHRTWF